ncbi:MAG: Hpt domain-containing protein [Lachnospiraceae bacterium]|nr:Hpt domain-containing protein [Lachnospiraceae bacterium]
MRLVDCYEQLEGDYSGVISRLMKESLVSKFLIMFLKDTQFNEFHSSLSEKNWENAFRNIHTLKGTCLNLGISKLASIASEITEELRGGVKRSDITDRVKLLDAEYQKTVDLIKEYSENPEF